MATTTKQIKVRGVVTNVNLPVVASSGVRLQSLKPGDTAEVAVGTLDKAGRDYVLYALEQGYIAEVTAPKQDAKGA